MNRIDKKYYRITNLKLATSLKLTNKNFDQSSDTGKSPALHHMNQDPNGNEPLLR